MSFIWLWTDYYQTEEHQHEVMMWVEYLIFNEWITSYKSWITPYYWFLNLTSRLGRCKFRKSIYLTGSGRPLRGLPSCYIAYLWVHIFLNGMWTQNKLVFYKPFILFTLFTIFKFYNRNIISCCFSQFDN